MINKVLGCGKEKIENNMDAAAYIMFTEYDLFR